MAAAAWFVVRACVLAFIGQHVPTPASVEGDYVFVSLPRNGRGLDDACARSGPFEILMFLRPRYTKIKTHENRIWIQNKIGIQSRTDPNLQQGISFTQPGVTNFT